MRHRIAVVLLPALLAGCASMTTPYSEVTGERFNLAIADRRAVFIISVGKQSGWISNAPVLVDPGTYPIEISTRGHAGFPPRNATITVTIEPCKRYYINAQFQDPVSQNFVPVIDHVETVAGCKRPA